MKKLFLLVLLFLLSSNVFAQTPRTLVKTVSTLPATCTAGVPQTDEVFKTGTGAGLYYCDSTNHWTNVATSNVPGIFSINGMTGSAQTIAIGTSGTAPAVSSSGNTTTINIPAAGSSASGIVTNDTQTIAGAKTLSSPLTITGTSTGTALSITTSDAAGSTVQNRNANTASDTTFSAGNDASKFAFLKIFGSTVSAGATFTNGPQNTNNSYLGASTNDFSIRQFGTDGSIWFATNDTARAKINSAGFTQWGTTSGTSTITPQAIAGTYTFKLPNTDPTVGQNVYVSGFSSGAVTLSYQDNGGGSGGINDVAGSADGLLIANQQVARYVADRAYTLGVSNSKCIAGTAATAQTDLSVTVNGVSKGTLRFAASGTTCTVVGAIGASIVSGDVIKVIGPASPDATLADISITVNSATAAAGAYDLPAQYNSDIPASVNVLRFVADRAFTLVITGSTCTADTAATAQADFLVTVNGTTKGTLRYAASGTTCTVVSPTSTAISIGDVVRVVSPASPDATLANIAVNVKGTNP